MVLLHRNVVLGGCSWEACSFLKGCRGVDLEKGEVDGTLEEWGRGGSSYDVLPERKIEKKKKIKS